MTLLKLLCCSVLVGVCAGSSWLPGEPVAVRQSQGVSHGFLVIRSASGAVIGHGDLIQTVDGERLTLRSMYAFRDGSVDEETTVYTQRGHFQVLSDRHMQRGPFFAKASDVLVEANGQVTVKTVDKEGKETVEVNHFDLPNDLANGVVGISVDNVRADTPEFKLSVLAGVGKGRIVKVAIAPEGKGKFMLGGVRRTANLFRVKTELGGIAGVVAPLIGKQPEDVQLWVMDGPAPVVIRGVRQLEVGGPMVSVEVTGGVFPRFVPEK